MTEHENATRAAWDEAAAKVNLAVAEKLSQWQAELDLFLFVSALLAGVAAAVVAVTIPALQPSHPDAQLLLLAQISTQLSSFSLNSAFANSTEPPLTASQAIESSTEETSVAIILVNLLLFISLVMSLGVVVTCIQCKQWVRYQTEGLHGDSWETQLIRQYRWLGITEWNFDRVMVNIAPLTTISVMSFLLGVVVLLWTFHPAVAAIPTLLVGLIMAAHFITVVLPVFYPECPFVSPQSKTWFRAMKSIFLAFPRCRRLVRALAERVQAASADKPFGRIAKAVISANCWTDYEDLLQRERELILYRGATLKANILRRRYTDFQDTTHLLAAGRLCIRDLPIDLHADVCESLWAKRCAFYGRRTPLLRCVSEGDNQSRLALHYLDLDMLERLADGPCDSACAGPILLLRRMLRISEVWPYDKPVDSLFFPVIAKYIERHCSCDVEELALAILRNVLLEVPHFPRHGFPSGSEDVMRGLGVIASRRKPEPPPVSCSAYTLFVTRALALYAVCIPQTGVPLEATDQRQEQAKDLIFSLDAFLETPLWRQWMRDPMVLRHCVDFVQFLTRLPDPCAARDLVTTSLVETFRASATYLEECGSPTWADQDWLDRRAEVLDYVAQLERVMRRSPSIAGKSTAIAISQDPPTDGPIVDRPSSSGYVV